MIGSSRQEGTPEGGRAGDTGAPSSLPILADRPAPRPRLGFQPIVKAIVKIVRGAHDSDEGFTVGVFGPWGSGKSSVLRSVARELKAAGDVVVVPFEAWRYANGKMLTVQLIKQLVEAMKASGVREDSLLNKVTDVATTVLAVCAGPVLGLLGSQIGIASGVEEGLLKAGKPEKLSQQATDVDLDELLRDISDELAAKESRAVVLIDDLDRCAPAEIAQIIGVLNTLMDYQRIIFVIALDRSYLVRAVTQAFSLHDEKGSESVAFGERFLEKIIQIPLNVPQIDFTGIDLGEFVGGRDMYILKSQYGFGLDEQEMVQYEIIPLALRSNPRQVKRFFNSYIISYFINHEAFVDPDHAVELRRGLLYMIGLRTASPTIYQKISDDITLQVNSAGTVDAGDAGSGNEELVFGELASVRAVLDPACEDADVRQARGENPLLTVYVRHIADAGLSLLDVYQVLQFAQVAGSVTEDAFSSEGWYAGVETWLKNPRANALFNDAVTFLRDLDRRTVRMRRSREVQTYLVRTPRGERPFCDLTFMMDREVRFVLRVGDAGKELAQKMDRDRAPVRYHYYPDGNPDWGDGDFVIAMKTARCYATGVPEEVKGLVRDAFEAARRA